MCFEGFLLIVLLPGRDIMTTATLIREIISKEEKLFHWGLAYSLRGYSIIIMAAFRQITENNILIHQ